MTTPLKVGSLSPVRNSPAHRAEAGIGWSYAAGWSNGVKSWSQTVPGGGVAPVSRYRVVAAAAQELVSSSTPCPTPLTVSSALLGSNSCTRTALRYGVFGS